MNHLKPAEILEVIMKTSEIKASMPLGKMIIFGIFAGVYIAFAGAGANMGSFNLLADPETIGLGKILSGTIFSVGLMLVALGGAELFTGNTTMTAAVIDRRIKLSSMLKKFRSAELTRKQIRSITTFQAIMAVFAQEQPEK